MYLSKVSKQYVVVVVLLLLAIFSSVIYVNKNVSAPLVGEIVDQAIKRDAAKHEVLAEALNEDQSVGARKVLVKFTDEALQLERLDQHPALLDIGVTSIETFTYAGNVSALAVNSPQSIKQIIDAIEGSGLVEYAESDYVVSAESINAPQIKSDNLSWGLHNSGVTGGIVDADIDAPEAWEAFAKLPKSHPNNTPRPVVAIIDTGIDLAHPALTPHLWYYSNEIPNSFGASACDNDSTSPADVNGHGTQVAGVIASLNVHNEFKLLPIKALCADGRGYHSDIIAAIDHLLTLKQQGVNISVANLSFGGSDNGVSLLSALQRLAKQNVVIVASAGNDSQNNDETPHYPSNYPISQMIVVAASDHSDQLASATNYGISTVDLAAPGVDIYTAQLNGVYGKSSGTSLSTAYISGAAAMAQIAFPSLSAINIKSRIMTSVDKRNQFSNKVVARGRLNTHNIFDLYVANQLPADQISFVDREQRIRNAARDRFGERPDISEFNRSKTANVLELDIVPNQIMMSFADEYKERSLVEKTQLLAPFGVKIIKDFPYAGGSVLLEINDAPSAALGKLPVGETKGSVYQQVNNVITQLQESGLVTYAESDVIFQASAVPNDTRYDELWGLKKIQAEQTWDYIELNNPSPAEMIIGVIDTGVDYNHPDLAANMWVNTGEIADNGLDDDDNGYVDDIYGWDAANDDGDPMDDHYHGTHVAGTIGAVRNNSEGIVGVTPYVRVMALKFLDVNGSGSSSAAIELLNYIHLMKQEKGVDIKLTNNSWGGGGYTQSLRDAIASSNDYGILFVAAAGNSGQDVDSFPHYPSSYDVANIISVAATDINDELASFSNYGSSVDIAAPGSNILSTYPNNSYNAISGTSMAAPHVSGAIGLLFAAEPDVGIADIKTRLIGSGDTLPSLVGKTTSSTRLNAYNFITAPAPAALFDVDIVGGIVSVPENSSVTVNVRLKNAPETSEKVVLTVVKQSGDDDINLTSASILTFDELNWSTWQAMTFFATEDTGISDDSAVFQLTSIDSIPQSIIIQEQDNKEIPENFCDIVSEIPVSECDALISFYQSTDGANWANSSGWLSTTTPCSWYGITCQSSRVTSLNFYSNNLVGELPLAISNLSELQTLDLYVNQLSGNILPELGDLVNLRYVDLAANSFSGSLPFELGFLTQLEVLYTENNLLSGSIPDVIGSLTNLRTLWLYRNKFDGEIPDSLLNSTSLSSVTASYNALELSGDDIVFQLDSNSVNTQTVPPKDVTLTVLNGDVVISWEPILYAGGGGEYIISTSDAVDGVYVEHGRTASKFDSSYVIGSESGYINRYFTIQSHTPQHSSNPRNDIISRASEAVFYSGEPEVLLPVIVPPSAIIVEATFAGGAEASNPAISQFLSSAQVTNTAQPVVTNAPSVFPLGVTTVVFSVCNVNADCVEALQTVTVEDTTAPLITVAPYVTYEATAQFTGIDFGSTTAVDLVDGDVKAIVNPISLYSVGEHSITWMAVDSAGNIGSAAQVISVQDTTPPAISVPANIVVEANAVLTFVDVGEAASIDIVDGNLVPVSDQLSAYPVGSHVVTWRVTDNAGLESIATQMVVVQDTTPPVLSTPPNLVETAGIEFDVGTATATDIFPVTLSSNAPTVLPFGLTTITWTAIDANGNESTAEQAVTLNPYYANRSSQIACEKGDDGDTAWVINSDNDSVSMISVSKNLLTSEQIVETKNDYFIFTDSKPSSITRVNNYVATTYADTGSIRFNQMDYPWIEGGTVPWTTWKISLGNEMPIASVAHNNMLYVALYTSGEIVKIDTVSRKIVSRLAVGPKPKAMALTSDGSRLLVTRFISNADYGEVYDILTAGNMSFRDEEQPTIRINKIWVPDDIDHGSGVANYLRGIVIDPKDEFAYITANKANIERGEYLSGSALSADNTIRSMMAVLDLTTHSDTNVDSLTRDDTIDLQNAADPSGLTFLPDGTTGVYALQGSNRIALYDFDTKSTLPVNVGAAPQGLCVTHESLYVNNYTDRTVSVINIEDYINTGTTALTSESVVMVAPEDDVLTATELQGLQLFYSANQAELSPEGYMSCASCHDGGGHDGMTWDFTHMGEGLRNTLSLRGTSGARFGPLNWSANSDEVQDIEKQLEQLHGSNGFIDGVTFTGQSPLNHMSAGSSAELDGLSAYVSSLGKNSVLKSPNYCAWDDSECWSTYHNGGWQYHAYGCKDCHAKKNRYSGAFRDGLTHDMGTITEVSGLGSNAILTAIRTPTLIELWDTAPYLHDGSAETLEEVMGTGVHATYGLDEREMRNLIQFLNNIDRSQYIGDDELFNP